MQINVALVREKSKDGLSRETWTTLFGREYVRRTLIGIMIMFFQQWSGINALLYYGPTLVESIGMRGDTVTLLVSGGIGIVQFLAVFPAIIFLDRPQTPSQRRQRNYGYVAFHHRNPNPPFPR
jgi:hypothetical protein